jgi:hypothetical protein
MKSTAEDTRLVTACVLEELERLAIMVSGTVRCVTVPQSEAESKPDRRHHAITAGWRDFQRPASGRRVWKNWRELISRVKGERDALRSKHREDSTSIPGFPGEGQA